MFHTSFVEALGEFEAEGRGAAGDETMIGSELREFGATWQAPDGFAVYVAKLHTDADPDAPRPEDRVPCTTWWWVEGSTFLGRIALRHRLNERLRRHGGHIGYDVRPAARRRGHATAMLAAVLPRARELGIDSALLTCEVGNVASRRVIEANGGVLEDELAGMLRYWVPTAQRSLTGSPTAAIG
jgi:predicted acetyltransferase